MHRRHALGRIAAAGLGGVLSARAQQSGSVPSWPTESRRLAANVYAYVQAGGPGVPSLSVSNAGMIAGEDHLLGIDSLGAPIHAKNFIAAATKTVPGKPFRRMVLTHHHSDHVWGLPFFPPKMEIVSHEYCRQAMLDALLATPGGVWEKRDGWAEGGEPRVVVPPTTTISEKATYYYGDTVVELLPMIPAHTYGDLVVYLPQHRILFAGDVGFFWVAPFLNSGHCSKWIDFCNRVLAMDVDVIVPGHGPIGGKKEIADMRGYLEAFKAEARRCYDAGLTTGETCASIRLGKYESWLGATDRLPLNVVRLYAEFAGTLVPATDTAGVRRATDEFNAIRKKG